MSISEFRQKYKKPDYCLPTPVYLKKKSNYISSLFNKHVQGLYTWVTEISISGFCNIVIAF